MTSVLWLAGFAFGLLTLRLARASPDYSLAGRSVSGALAELGPGWVLMAVGLAAGKSRPGNRFGALLAAAGFGWFLVEWNNPGTGSSTLFTLGLALFALCPPLVAHAVLAYPGGRVASLPSRVALGVAYTGALALGVGHALVFDPQAEGCQQCPRNVLNALTGVGAGTVDRLDRAAVILGVAWSGVLVALVVLRIARYTPSLRRISMPVALPGVLYLSLVAATFGHSVSRGMLSNDVADRRLWLGQAVALVGLGAGATSSRLRARRTRAALAHLVVDLAGSPAPGGLQSALARTLGDDALRLGYPLPDGRVVDAAGHDVLLDGSATTLVRGGHTVALLEHRAGLLDDPRLAEEVASAARLALENERLRAELAARLGDLRASRMRIIAAGDEGRRRLERDLHDGAQQHLVTLLLSLTIARQEFLFLGDQDQLRRLDEATAELRIAVGELRDLAHGIFPGVLVEEGFSAALETLVEASPTPVTVIDLPAQRLPASVETAGYLVVRQVLRRSSLRSVTLRATCSGDSLVIDMWGEGEAPTPMVDVEDRIGALGGSLVLDRTRDGRVTVHVEIPCGS